MNLALKLFRQSAAHSKGRLALITFAISIGVAMILSFSAYVSALVNTQEDLYAAYYMSPQLSVYLESAESSANSAPAGTSEVADASTANNAQSTLAGEENATTESVFAAIPQDAVLAYLRYGTDVQKVGTEDVRMLYLQPSSANPPDLHGLSYPQPGEFYASTALAKTLQENPEWSVRYGTKYLGELPHAFTSSPDDYFAIVGTDQLSNNLDSSVVETWETRNEPQGAVAVIIGVLYLGLGIVLFPVALLISISAKLGNVQREQRYAALRLAGATNRQVFWIVTTETLIASSFGYLIGIGLYFAAHPLLTQIRLETKRFWPENISVSVWHYLATAALTFLLVYFANGWGLKRLAVSPLGVIRRQTMEKQPSILRMIPIFIGVGIFLWLWFNTEENNIDSQGIWAILAAVVLIMFGLTISGTWFTAKIAQLCGKFTRKPSGYIGWKYVRAHASQISRSVAGVVLALFAGSFFLTAVSDVNLDFEVKTSQSILADDTVILALNESSSVGGILAAGSAQTSSSVSDEPSTSEALDASKAADEANSSTDSDALAKSLPKSSALDQSDSLSAQYAELAKNISGVHHVNQIETFAWMPMLRCDSVYLAKQCSEIARNTGASDTAIKDSEVVAINYGAPLELGESVVIGENRADILAQLSTIGVDSSMAEKNYPYLALQVDSLQTLENLRTEIAKQHLDLPNLSIYPSEKYSTAFFGSSNPMIQTLTKITYFGIIATIVIATISLLVSTYASILERRRTLLTLRLNGMTLREIYRMILVESLAPLLAISIFAVLLGIGTGWIFMDLVSTTLGAKISPIFIAVLFGSLLASALAIRSVLPAVKTATALSANRQE